MIEIQDLYAGYSSKPVLQGIDLCCPSGQVIAIVGKNGCGKSTLLKVLAGMLPAISGIIKINGYDISSYSKNKLAKTVSYLPQGRNIPEITAYRMVLHGRFPYLSYPRVYREEDHEIVRDCMEKLKIYNLKDIPLSNLSGGIRQKVYIAMALAQGTSVILMDEPTTYLDISHQFQVMDHARELAACGKTVILVLHDLATALQIADQIAVMDEGKILFCGNSEDVYSGKYLDQVFHTHIQRYHTPSGWQYYFERR